MGSLTRTTDRVAAIVAERLDALRAPDQVVEWDCSFTIMAVEDDDGCPGDCGASHRHDPVVSLMVMVRESETVASVVMHHLDVTDTDAGVARQVEVMWEKIEFDRTTRQLSDLRDLTA